MQLSVNAVVIEKYVLKDVCFNSLHCTQSLLLNTPTCKFMIIDFFIRKISTGKENNLNGLQSDLPYLDCLVSSNNVGLVRYPYNWNR